MNYLAHIFLAGPDQDAMIGALLGDFVKGDAGTFPPAVGAEIVMHRRVDVYTDAHAVVRQARDMFAPQRRRYAGILLDVFYDHVLSQRWPAYSGVPLAAFIRHFYDGLVVRRELLPPPMQPIAERMAAEDWLGAYQSLEGVERAVNRISLRLSKNGHHLRDSLIDLREHHEALAAGFDVFFPQLRDFVAQLRAAPLAAAATPAS
jgi:acyl carrier protein phosphodiesterase